MRNPRPHGLPGELIVSLTSYPPRFPTLSLTLKSLIDQSVRADRLILWIGHDDMASLPEDVKALELRGLQIVATQDLGPFTKLIPTLSAYPSAFIVSADDDVYYPPTWLRRLVEGSKANLGAIITMRAHLANQTPQGRFVSYSNWDLETRKTQSQSGGRPLFLTGVGGVLYPPASLADEVFDERTFKELAPFADDVWFFWMAGLKGTQIVRADGRFDLVTWPSSQEVGLYQENLLGDRNDRQIRAMEQRYGPYRAAKMDNRGVLPTPPGAS